MYPNYSIFRLKDDVPGNLQWWEIRSALQNHALTHIEANLIHLTDTVQNLNQMVFKVTVTNIDMFRIEVLNVL